MTLVDWEWWRLLNAGIAFFAFLGYTYLTAVRWPEWTWDERRIAGAVCALLLVTFLGSMEAYQSGQPIILTSFALAAVLLWFASALVLDHVHRKK